MSRPSRGNNRRLFQLLIVAAAMVAAGTGAFLVSTQATHSSAKTNVIAAGAAHAPAAANKSTSAADPSTSSDVDDPPSSSVVAVHDVLFVGASYTAGLGATPSTEGYAYVVGRDPGWQSQINGVSGTGFLNGGPKGNQTFAERIPKIATHPHPDLVIFQGGRNDVSFPAAKLKAAAITTAELTRKRFIGAQVVFLGPIPARVPAPADQVAVANTLRAAAAASHAIFIDPIEQGWITPENQDAYEGHVVGHPDNEGYAYIAKRLLIDLNALYPVHASA